MTAAEILGLVVAGAIGGAMNAVAGGGTLVTFPTLLFFGTPPIVANATSTVALVIGTWGSLYGYRRHLEAVRRWLWSFVPISLVGGWIGGVLLTRTSNKTFAKLVPFLILFATILFLAQGLVRRLWAAPLQERPPHPGPLPLSGAEAVGRRTHALWGAVVFQFAVAIYGGYFGAGMGILMLASLGFLGLGNIYEMNTLKTILGSLINLVAAVWFIYSGLIHWQKAGILTVGALAGYYLGAHYSQRIAPARVRQVITVIGFVLAAVTFYEEFIR